ncbi:hypothetical protein NC651_030887 [Populus alba x Populus x berolinensis]|nr:hypothetical protein NC651_030887 [Populus alba x Populus x berolinensis]
MPTYLLSVLPLGVKKPSSNFSPLETRVSPLLSLIGLFLVKLSPAKQCRSKEQNKNTYRKKVGGSICLGKLVIMIIILLIFLFTYD